LWFKYLDQTSQKSSNILCGNTCDGYNKREQPARCIAFDMQNGKLGPGCNSHKNSVFLAHRDSKGTQMF